MARTVSKILDCREPAGIFEIAEVHLRAKHLRAMKMLLSALLAFASMLLLPLGAEERKEPPAKGLPPAKAAPAAEVKYEGGDGSSMEKAIIIKGAKGSEAGIGAEYAWLAKKYPGYKTREQALLGDKKKKYDMISITTGECKQVEVYFDISEFFGKF
jgi:hypothetical protein